MCKLMYPFVPASMRTPEGIQMLMSKPDVQEQLEKALQKALKVNVDCNGVCRVCLSAHLCQSIREQMWPVSLCAVPVACVAVQYICTG